MDTGLTPVLLALPYAVLGFAGGWLYFLALGAGVRATLSDGGRVRGLVLHGGRIVGAVALFWAVATQGAAPLLLTFMGFLAARVIQGRRAKNRGTTP